MVSPHNLVHFLALAILSFSGYLSLYQFYLYLFLFARFNFQHALVKSYSCAPAPAAPKCDCNCGSSQQCSNKSTYVNKTANLVILLSKVKRVLHNKITPPFFLIKELGDLPSTAAKSCQEIFVKRR